MKDKLNQFIENTQGHFQEVSYRAAIYQCMDLVYEWVFVLGYPKGTIQHLYASQVWTQPNDLTRQYFDLLENTPEFVPQDGDLAVFSGGVAGHIGIALSGGNTSTFMMFEQNSPLGSNAHIGKRSYSNILGFLRPKVFPENPPIEFTDQTLIPIGGEWGEMQLQATISTLNDQAQGIRNLTKDLKNCREDSPKTLEFENKLAKLLYNIALSLEGK